MNNLISNTISIRTQCNCGDTKDIEVDAEKYSLWKNRKIMIQEAFPDLSLDDRERLMTGTCEDCWDQMWKDLEDQEFDYEGYDENEEVPF